MGSATHVSSLLASEMETTPVRWNYPKKIFNPSHKPKDCTQQICVGILGFVRRFIIQILVSFADDILSFGVCSFSRFLA